MRATIVMVACALLPALPLQAQCNPPGTESFDGAAVATTLSCGTTGYGTYPAGWNLDPTSSNAWRVHSGSTPSFNTGPSGDHSTGSGNYLYTETSCSSGSWVAILNLPCFDANGITNPTIEFWYHMFGADMGTLDLQEFDGTNWNTIWTLSGNQGNSWQFAQVPVVPVSLMVQTRFVGTRGASFTSDMALDDVRFGAATPPDWQQNSPAADIDLDGLQAQPFGAPAVTTVCTGTIVTFSMGTTFTGWPHDLALTAAPVISRSAGALTTTAGQVVNIDVFDPSLTWLNSGTASANLLPFPNPFIPIPIQLAAPGTASAQLVVVNPVSVEGFTLSQASQLTTVGPGTVSGPNVDDGFVQVNLGAPPLCGPATAPFFGTAYTEVYVNSNGRISFTGGDPDFSPTIGEALSGPPSGGYWTDLNPSAGGSIDVTSLGSGFRVDWVNVPFFGEAGATASFGMELCGSCGAFRIDGLTGVMANPITSGFPSTGDSVFLGISGGGAFGATDGGPTVFGAGMSGSPGVATDMIYDFYDAPVGGAPALPASLQPGTLGTIIFSVSGSSYTWNGL